MQTNDEKMLSVAKYIVDKYKLTSPVKLQKLMYFSYLNFYNDTGKLMFNEKFEAWILGPVLRRVYLHTRDFGLNFSYVLSTKVITENNAIKNISVDKKIISDLTDQEIINVIDKTWEQYGNMSPRDLVDESHKTSPWIKARNGIQENEPSDNQISLV